MWIRRSLVGTALVLAAAAVFASDRPWTPADSVAVRYFFAEPDAFTVHPKGFLPSDPIVWAPDRLHFFFITFHGDLSCDCNPFELQVFSVDELKRALSKSRHPQNAKPLRSVVMRSARSEQGYFGIGQARWENERAILFVGVEDKGPRQVYRLNVQSGDVERLTDERHDVEHYELGGGSIVYDALSFERRTRPDQYPAVTLDDDDLKDWLFPFGQRYTTFTSFHGNAVQPVVGAGAHEIRSVLGPWISPDGKWAVMLMSPSAEFPASPIWGRYVGWDGLQTKSQRFMLVDLENGHSRPVFDAPVGWATLTRRSSGSPWLGRWVPATALWSADSRHVILVNTALPLTEDEENRTKTAYVVDYDISTGDWSIVEPMETSAGWAMGARWTSPASELLIGHTDKKGMPAADVAYAMVDGRWGAAARAKPNEQKFKAVPPTAGLSVTIRQSVNDPPIAIASDGKNEVRLTSADPALRGIARARVQPIHWQERGGRTMSGGLMLPREFSSSKPVPLVIQAYWYAPDRFLPDGITTTGYAAQALASQGIAVLQTNLPYGDYDDVKINTAQNSVLFVQRVDAIVESLARQGYIDPSRVGLNGFMVSGHTAYYAATHPGRTKLAAVVLARPLVYDVSDYLHWSIHRDGTELFESEYGPGTFWQNKENWLEHGLAVNVDKVRAPLLFMTSAANGNFLGAFETRNAFRLSGRPIETLVFPASPNFHLLRPRERLVSMEATVDWMNFWLRGAEDPSPAKAERYVRWRQMRAQNSYGQDVVLPSK